ncbi:YicC/YloC family endoribonuclease [Paenibacillus marinisediminis]
MVFSMTGYGQSAKEIGGYKISIEMKSVNHRYSEIVFRMPREWTCFEDRLRRIVQNQLKRGRVDVFINKEREAESTSIVEVNLQVVEAYMQAADQLRQKYGMTGTVEINQLLSLPDVMTVREQANWSEEQLETCLVEGLTEALDGLCRMRAQEGSHLKQDTEKRLLRVEAILAELVKWAPEVVVEYRAKLKQRLEQLSEQHLTFDDTKFGMEVALFAERSNIDEELTRLKSHIQQFNQLLSSQEPVGRKLDFLIQEMNRETNTIGSKANHLELVNRVVDMKAELEKIREQVANME